MFAFFAIEPLIDKSEGEDYLAGYSPDEEWGGDITVGENCLKVMGFTFEEQGDRKNREDISKASYKTWNFCPETKVVEVADIDPIGDDLSHNYCEIIA
ncbi:hypothetical protein LA52FAK_35620 [Desulforhopalus sp. 52FAK]